VSFQIKNIFIEIFIVIFTVSLFVYSCGDNPTDIGIPPVPEKIWSDYHSVWSGVHDLIAYIHVQETGSDDPDSSGIYVIKPDGTEKKLLFRHQLAIGLDWSPDGTKLIANVITNVITNVEYILMTISYPDGDVDTLTPAGQYFDPVWSPNGSMIAFASHWGDERGIYFIDNDGSNCRKIISYGHKPCLVYNDSLLYINFDTVLTSGSICMSDTTGNFKREILAPANNVVRSTTRPRMHRNTGRITFHAQESGKFYQNIWILENGYSETTKLLSMAGYPAFSPNGDKIVFSKREDKYDRLWIINWDGTGLRQLTY